MDKVINVLLTDGFLEKAQDICKRLQSSPEPVQIAAAAKDLLMVCFLFFFFPSRCRRKEELKGEIGHAKKTRKMTPRYAERVLLRVVASPGPGGPVGGQGHAFLGL